MGKVVAASRLPAVTTRRYLWLYLVTLYRIIITEPMMPGFIMISNILESIPAFITSALKYSCYYHIT